MGPTRIQAGSHLFSHPGIPRNIIIPNFLNAGTFILLHFDIIHAAWINHSFKDRFMIKFVFSRTENPKNADTLNYLGFTTRKLGDYETGEKYYLQGLEINPSHEGINEYLGELYVATNRIDLAKKRLEVLKSCNCKEYKELKLVIEGKKESKY